MDEWGLDGSFSKKSQTKGKVQIWKILGSSLILIGVIGGLVFAFYPKNTVESKQEDNKVYDVTKASDNYGYPEKVEVPEKVKDTVDNLDASGVKASDSQESVLTAVRDSASEVEAGWDTSKYGSRKFIDSVQPLEVEEMLLDDKSVIKKLIDNVKPLGRKDTLKDGSYILINSLDEKQMYWKKEIYDLLGSKKYVSDLGLVYVNEPVAQGDTSKKLLVSAGYGNSEDDWLLPATRVTEVHDYPMLLTVREGKVVAKKTKIDDFKSALEGWK